MSLAVFPLSPLPAGMSRLRDWNEGVDNYDSGASQGISNRVRPMYRYQIPFQNINENGQGSLSSFVDDLKGRTTPFLMKDPYEFAVDSNIAVRSGLTDAATLQLYTVKSFFVHADSTTISSLFSADSGFVRLGVEYDYDQDTGLFTINTKDTTDVWGVRSMQYFKKCRLDQQYADTGIIWNQFSVRLSIREIV